MIKLFVARSGSYEGAGIKFVNPKVLKQYIKDLLKTPESNNKKEILELGLQQLIDMIEEEGI
jgi:hypothetical protein